MGKKRRGAGGRPSTLPMQLRIEIAVAWAEAHAGARVCIEPQPSRRRAVERLQRKIKAAHLDDVAPHLIKRLSDKLDAIGRYSCQVVLPPRVALPSIDRAIARRYGVTHRMVRRIRRDKTMWPFMPNLPWKVPEWQLRDIAQHRAKPAAKLLMTPERYNKREQIALTKDGLAVEQVPGLEAEYIAAWRALSVQRRYAEPMPLEYRRPPVWLAYLPQWDWYLRMRYLTGRRIKTESDAE